MQFEFGKYGKHDEIGEFPEKICSSGDCGTSNKPPNKLEIWVSGNVVDGFNWVGAIAAKKFDI